MNVINLAHWEISLRTMLEDEAKFYDKSWIAKPILAECKKRLDRNKLKTLTLHIKNVQS